MKVRIKWLTGLLALLMCAVAFAACSGKDQPTQTDTGTGVSEPNGTGEETLPAVETDANGYVLDSIPADVNYHGKQINLLCWQENIHTGHMERKREHRRTETTSQRAI